MGDPGDPWSDDAVHRPLFEHRDASRDVGSADERTWMAFFQYRTTDYNDYGQPYRTTNWQYAEAVRIVERTFQHVFTPYLVGRVLSETASYSGTASFAPTGSTSRSDTYASATGFLTSATVDGVTTTFSATDGGNVYTATDALGRVTTFSYAWGVLTGVQPPTVSSGPQPPATTRQVREDGQPTSVTRTSTRLGGRCGSRRRWPAAPTRRRI